MILDLVIRFFDVFLTFSERFRLNVSWGFDVRCEIMISRVFLIAIILLLIMNLLIKSKMSRLLVTRVNRMRIELVALLQGFTLSEHSRDSPEWNRLIWKGLTRSRLEDLRRWIGLSKDLSEFEVERSQDLGLDAYTSRRIGKKKWANSTWFWWFQDESRRRKI